MTLLLHLSDTHFGTERPELVEAVQRLAAQQKPALVIASGDITQRARRAQFDAARRFLDSLGAPLLVIPGNHDIPLFDLPRRLLDPYRGFARAFGAELEPRVALPGAWVAGLNTTRAWRHKHGEVSTEQADAAVQWLADAPTGALRVVVTHQPTAVLRAHDLIDALRGGREAARRWARGGVHLVLGGHIHLPYIVPLQTLWPELQRPLWLAQAGTAVSRRVRPEAGPSLNLVRHLAGTAWRVERWDHAAATRGFEPGATALLDAAM